MNTNSLMLGTAEGTPWHRRPRSWQRHCRRPLRQRSSRGRRWRAPALWRGETAHMQLVELQPDLPLIAQGLEAVGLLLRLAQDQEEQASQDRDHGDNHQQSNQREGAAGPGRGLSRPPRPPATLGGNDFMLSSWQAGPFGRGHVILVPVEAPELFKWHLLYMSVEENGINRSGQALLHRHGPGSPGWPASVTGKLRHTHLLNPPRQAAQIDFCQSRADRPNPVTH
jgi:hypothetical protein